MAALVVQSRFAGLKIEDDDCSSDVGLKGNKSKANNVKKPEVAKKAVVKNGNNNKSQSAGKKKKGKGNPVTSAQWEQWKQKDEELVDGNFEDELQQAILLSKLDYEEKKDVYKQVKKQSGNQKKIDEQVAKSNAKTNKKQKKKNVMSLEQFNDMMNGDEVKGSPEEEKDSLEEPKENITDTEFFERIKSETKTELFKDKMNDRVRNRLTVSEEVITRVQFMDALEKKDKEIAGLRQEVLNLKQELLTVKSRNKKLCNILGQGEMKDKAEVLVEVERLRAVQAELTAELGSLHTDLEKERSKNTDPRANPRDKKSGTKKKNIRFDASSEAILAKESSSGTAG